MIDCSATNRKWVEINILLERIWTSWLRVPEDYASRRTFPDGSQYTLKGMDYDDGVLMTEFTSCAPISVAFYA